MLVYGTIEGAAEDDSHAGVYLRKGDVEEMVARRSLLGKPILIEHSGPRVGEVVSAWRHGDRLDCVFRLENDSIDSMFAREFVRGRRCPELSLGYNVRMEHSGRRRPRSEGGAESDGEGEGGGKRMRWGSKEALEVSLVKQGARPACHIRAFSMPS